MWLPILEPFTLISDTQPEVHKFGPLSLENRQVTMHNWNDLNRSWSQNGIFLWKPDLWSCSFHYQVFYCWHLVWAKVCPYAFWSHDISSCGILLLIKVLYSISYLVNLTVFKYFIWTCSVLKMWLYLIWYLNEDSLKGEVLLFWKEGWGAFQTSPRQTSSWRVWAAAPRISVSSPCAVFSLWRCGILHVSGEFISTWPNHSYKVKMAIFTINNIA